MTSMSSALRSLHFRRDTITHSECSMRPLPEQIVRAAESIALRWVEWGSPSSVNDGSGGLVPLRTLSLAQLSDFAKLNAQAAGAAAETFGETTDPLALKAAAEYVMASRALCVSLAEKKGEPFSEADAPYPRVGFNWPSTV